MTDRRQVRVASALFDQLDELLGADRGPQGQPSATDFVVLELPAIVERFATDFNRLPPIEEGLESARMLIGTGMLVRAFVVFGILATDGAIDLVGLGIDE